MPSGRHLEMWYVCIAVRVSTLDRNNKNEQVGVWHCKVIIKLLKSAWALCVSPPFLCKIGLKLSMDPISNFPNFVIYVNIFYLSNYMEIEILLLLLLLLLFTPYGNIFHFSTLGWYYSHTFRIIWNWPARKCRIHFIL